MYMRWSKNFWKTLIPTPPHYHLLSLPPPAPPVKPLPPLAVFILRRQQADHCWRYVERREIPPASCQLLLLLLLLATAAPPSSCRRRRRGRGGGASGGLLVRGGGDKGSGEGGSLEATDDPQSSWFLSIPPPFSPLSPFLSVTRYVSLRNWYPKILRQVENNDIFHAHIFLLESC